MTTVYVATGGNVGDVPRNREKAVSAVDSIPGVAVFAVSPLYETAPVGGPEGQPPFLNGALGVETSLSPDELMAALLGVEKSLGRVREIPDGPRTVDLDILLWGGSAVETKLVTAPHPRMHLRSFVLVPLADIVPGGLHPILKKTVAELLRDLGEISGIKQWGGVFAPGLNRKEAGSR